MKILNLFILSSILFLTVSCNNDKYSITDEDIEIRNDGTYVSGEVAELRHDDGIYDPEEVTEHPLQRLLEMRTGYWTPTGCELGGTRKFVFIDYPSCACQKELIISQLGENDCYVIDKPCLSTNKVVDTQCAW